MKVRIYWVWNEDHWIVSFEEQELSKGTTTHKLPEGWTYYPVLKQIRTPEGYILTSGNLNKPQAMGSDEVRIVTPCGWMSLPFVIDGYTKVLGKTFKGCEVFIRDNQWYYWAADAVTGKGSFIPFDISLMEQT